MAELAQKIDVTISDLEKHLSRNGLQRFIDETEKSFMDRIDSVVQNVLHNDKINVVFISGPTSSGKTTFTKHFSKQLRKRGKEAFYLSLDDYYFLEGIFFDKMGRPDYETIKSVDTEYAVSDIVKILNGEAVLPPEFDFNSRQRVVRDSKESVTFGDNGLLLVEGLHALSDEISGKFDQSKIAKIFIMPYGNLYADAGLMDSTEIRLIRRIARDYRHRGAHALATIDYWPIIAKNEELYFDKYLENADYHINSILEYETLITAPMALHDLNEAMSDFESGVLSPSVFMEKSPTGKKFADLSLALKKADELLEDLSLIPAVPPEMVPGNSILSEFITSV